MLLASVLALTRPPLPGRAGTPVAGLLDGLLNRPLAESPASLSTRAMAEHKVRLTERARLHTVELATNQAQAGNNLPAGWSSALDPVSGQRYFFNEEETTWNPPIDEMVELLGQVTPTEVTPRSSGWEQSSPAIEAAAALIAEREVARREAIRRRKFEIWADTCVGVPDDDFDAQARLGKQAADRAEDEHPLDQRILALEATVQRLRDAHAEVASAEQELSQLVGALDGQM